MPRLPANGALTMFLLLIQACAAADIDSEPTELPAAGDERVRVAVFNIRELTAAKVDTLDSDGAGADPQARAAATIIQRVRPDVLVINEIDHELAATPEVRLEEIARRFARNYLQTGEAPLDYPYAWAGPNNTGRLSGVDLDNDGHVAIDADRGERRHGNDSFGYGEYPGQYSIAVLSRFPLANTDVRTFQRFLWADLEGNHLPADFYSEEAIGVLRLSSKSHQDLPVQIGEHTLHLWMSHPIPPVFDGEEDRNGRRNFDEIRLWVEYLDGGALLDDQGQRGGYVAAAPFMILGDLNARPDDEDSRYDGRSAISQLLQHPRIRDTGDVAISTGAPADVPAATTAFRGRGARIDYVLPGVELEVLDGGVFWPAAATDPEGNALAEEASDHRLVWLDVAWPPRRD